MNCKIKNKLVPCRRIKYSPLVDLDYCQKCKLHAGIVIISPKTAKDPAQEGVSCNMPRVMPIANVVEEDSGLITLNKGVL